MNTEDINPALAYYVTALLIIGLACLFNHLFVSRNRETPAREIALQPWPVKGLDLALIITFIYLLIFVAGALTVGGYSLIYGSREIPQEQQFIFGYPMHLAILASLYGFFRYFNLAGEVPFNPVRLGPSSLLLKSLYFFLASMPILIVGGFAWPYVLEFLHLPTDPQDLVTQVGGMGWSTQFILVAFLAVILAPVSEEFLFRAFIYRSFKNHLSPTLSTVLTSLLFAGMHFNWLSFLPLFLLGMWLCHAYEETGNIFVPVLLHAFFNANTLVVLLLSSP